MLLDGITVTPVGSPLTVYVTSPENPLVPVTPICTESLCRPCATVIVSGVAVMLKSGPVGPTTVIVSCTVAVCDNVPEVPVKRTCTGVAVAGASLAAVSVTASGLFTVSEMVDGDTVTPVGRPVTVTAIVPLKPSIAVLLSVTCPLAPGASASVLGVAVSVKSPFDGGPVDPDVVTVNATGMLVLRVPDAPYTLTVVVPTAASAAAVSVNVVLEPMATVAVAGDTVTPEGSPLTET